MTDRNFGKLRDTFYERGKIVHCEIVPGIDSKAERSGRPCRLFQPVQLARGCGRVVMGRAVRPGIKLHMVGTDSLGAFIAERIGIGEEKPAFRALSAGQRWAPENPPST